MDSGVHILVKGIVQGVGFRYYVFDRAIQLGIRGFARNLRNGNVEIKAYGERSLIEEFIAAVKIGPRSAQVTDVMIEWSEPDVSYKNFEIW